MKAANALLFKVNQVGTLSEALGTAQLAFRNGYSIEVSVRSGETENAKLADIAVGITAKQIKLGALDRPYVYYNRLLRIEEELGSLAKYPTGLRNT
jgi:enolase